ncbi:MAG: hypothetical protein HEQ32_01795 [Vampirovibrio sp.]
MIFELIGWGFVAFVLIAGLVYGAWFLLKDRKPTKTYTGEPDSILTVITYEDGHQEIEIKTAEGSLVPKMIEKSLQDAILERAGYGFKAQTPSAVREASTMLEPVSKVVENPLDDIIPPLLTPNQAVENMRAKGAKPSSIQFT